MQQGNVMAEDQIIENGFWDIADLSSYLKVKVKTIYAMTSVIPHYRVGKLIRFRKQEIDSWMESRRAKAFEGVYKSKNIKLRIKRCSKCLELESFNLI
jgi:excisionase family DNA binding protein